MAPSSAKARRASNAQAKVAAMRRAEAARRRRLQISFVAVGVVVAIIIALVAVSLAGGNHNTNTAGKNGRASAAVVQAVTGVPRSVFDQVGTGAVAASPLHPISGKVPPLTSGGLPKVLFVGADYCPYCAAERWAIVAALSRFGTFHALGQTASTSADVNPNTPTLSFHGASYTSKYLNFTAYETETRSRQPLDSLGGADQKTFSTFDAPPYLTSSGSIPFMDFGGKYLLQGASYDPGLLSGMSHLQVAKALHDPSSDVAKSADAVANYMTAAICKITGGQPATVCTSSGVKAASAKLG